MHQKSDVFEKLFNSEKSDVFEKLFNSEKSDVFEKFLAAKEGYYLVKVCVVLV